MYISISFDLGKTLDYDFTLVNQGAKDREDDEEDEDEPTHRKKKEVNISYIFFCIIWYGKIYKLYVWCISMKQNNKEIKGQPPIWEKKLCKCFNFVFKMLHNEKTIDNKNQLKKWKNTWIY